MVKVVLRVAGSMKLTCVTPKQAKAEAFVVGVHATDDKRQAPGLKVIGQQRNAQAKRLLQNKNAALGAKQVASVPLDDKGAVLVLVGLGPLEKLTQEKVGTCLHRGLEHAKALGITRVATTLASDAASKDGLDEGACVQAAVHGAVIGQLAFDQWKRKDPKAKKEQRKAHIATVQFIHERPASIRSRLDRAQVAAEAVNDARLLANTPANVATPKWMAAEARKRGRQHGFKVSVKGRAQLRKEKYGAICAVAQGSVNEEQLVIMEWAPPGTARQKPLVIVGKGVCFDSGGISIKPGQNMWDMKYDKCGACNTIAAMVAVARLKTKRRVVGIAPCVENMPSGTAQRPGDIITAKDGTTIEVLNTDAEGRLILADAVHLATTMKPEWILETSTLTGACDYAVGSTYVAVMSKQDEFAKSIVEAAWRAGDKAWQLPQGEEFDEANKGAYGDLQNISLTNKAGTSIGGSFISHFAKDEMFGHLDIASKAWTSGTDYFAKGPTGAGVRIVLERILAE